MPEPQNPQGEQPPQPAVIYDFDPRNLPPEYLKAVGFAAMAAAQTENVVQDLIGALVGADNMETLALTTNMSAPLRDRIARALIELNATNAQMVDDVDELLNAIVEAMAKRNIIVHNPLIRNPQTGEILSHRLKAQGSLQLELRPITVAEIEKDAIEVYEVGIALMQFMVLRGIMPAYRKLPMREPLDRRKKARESRREILAGGGAA